MGFSLPLRFRAIVLASLFSSVMALAHPSAPVPTSIQRIPATEGSKTLVVMSWNVKRLGRAKFAVPAGSDILDKADVITFQEVNKSDSGLSALKRMAKGLEARTKERICMGLSTTPTGARERFGFLWKNSRISYVRADGHVIKDCPKTAITIRLGVRNAERIRREPAFGTFFFKPGGHAFVLVAVHLLPSGKKPQLEVPPLFETLDEVKLPMIVAGDFNLDSTHSAFHIARKMGFHAAMKGVKTSLKRKKRELNKPYDNFWFRGTKLLSWRVIDLYQAFPKLDAREIYNNLSDHSPIVGEFQFDPPQLAELAPSPN